MFLTFKGKAAGHRGATNQRPQSGQLSRPESGENGRGNPPGDRRDTGLRWALRIAANVDEIDAVTLVKGRGKNVTRIHLKSGATYDTYDIYDEERHSIQPHADCGPPTKAERDPLRDIGD